MTRRTTKLKYVARFRYGDTLPTRDAQEGNVKVFGSNGPFALSSTSNTGSPAIVVGRKGSYGKVNWSSKECFASDTTFFIDSDSCDHDLRWLFWLLQTLRLDEGTDEAAVPGLRLQIAYSMDVVVPLRAEQRAIASFLDVKTTWLDALIAKKERLLRLIAEKRQALIQHVVTRGLAPLVATTDTYVDRLRELPAHWQVDRLKFIAPVRSNKLTSVPSGQVFIGLENIEPQTGRLLLRTPASKVESTVNWFAAGDVLFGKLRPYLAKVGRPTVSGVCTTEIVALQPVGCSQAYLFYALLNDSFIRWLDSLTFGSKMPRVSPEQVANAFIAIPPEVEQQAIADFLDRETAKIDALVAKVREAIERLKEYRLALISAAVTGKIDVRAESAL